MSITITSLRGESITDSRNVPTLLVTVLASDGSIGTFAVPSGASTGAHEAYELRDDGTAHGGVTHACEYISGEISQALVGKDIFAQQDIDDTLRNLDGTENKSRLGGNTLIGISIAVAKTASKASEKEVWEYLHDTYFSQRKTSFPRLYANLINGGKHATTPLAFQEYHVVPKVTSPRESSILIARIQEKLLEVASARFDSVVTGDEGGYALPLTDVVAPLTLLDEVVTGLGVREQVEFALDVASSSFYDTEKNMYHVGNDDLDVPAMMALYAGIEHTFKLLSIEDPFDEEDFGSFSALPTSIGNVLRVGDDLTTTSKERLLRALQEKSVDSLIIKPNQIGTLSETIETMLCAYEHDIKCIISHRSGETLDDFIADLAYGSGAFGIKLGARGPLEREAKYSRLIAIENVINE